MLPRACAVSCAGVVLVGVVLILNLSPRDLVFILLLLPLQLIGSGLDVESWIHVNEADDGCFEVFVDLSHYQEIRGQWGGQIMKRLGMKGRFL